MYKLEKEEASKMESIMSGIIERTNAKMQKLGISESKLERSIKFIWIFSYSLNLWMKSMYQFFLEIRTASGSLEY